MDNIMDISDGNDDFIGFGEGARNNFNKSVTKKSKTKCGSFQGMGLSVPILKGILRRGYKIPTPIQRKTIPLVLANKDVVAMARTGSGKTACFLLPLFEKLMNKPKKRGARALILTPTRELALQTLKFIRELGKFTELETALILGGEPMEKQFSAMHDNPDIIVATPGRFLHVCVEMDLKPDCVEYLVFDEADRLFEMGFGQQLCEILNRIPENRQTLLFSATLPKVLVEFSKAGLNNPVLIRLDVDTKLPDQLRLAYIFCRLEDKTAALLCLLKYVIPNSQTIVFAATKYHVEFIHMILEKSGISSTFIFSDLDSSARKINAAKFQNKIVNVLIVTDIAARGIDIPHLDNVINYNFPAKAKLFVHRVGRCARAGRSGNAFSLVCNEDLAYLYDLHLFLDRSLKVAEMMDDVKTNSKNDFPDDTIGKVPGLILEEEQNNILKWCKEDPDIESINTKCNNAYKKYKMIRSNASLASIRKAKRKEHEKCRFHPVFTSEFCDEDNRINLLEKMKHFKSIGTIFEMTQFSESKVMAVMKQTRKMHAKAIKNYQDNKRNVASSWEESEMNNDLPVAKKKMKTKEAELKDKVYIDKQHYIPYNSLDTITEKGLAVGLYDKESSKLELSLTADDDNLLYRQKQALKKWDRKKKKIVGISEKKPKIRTESGVLIPASYRSKRYEQWKDKNKIDDEKIDDNDDDDDHNTGQAPVKKFVTNSNTHWARHNEKLLKTKGESELKSRFEVVNERMRKAKNKFMNKKKKKVRQPGGPGLVNHIQRKLAKHKLK